MVPRLGHRRGGPTSAAAAARPSPGCTNRPVGQRRGRRGRRGRSGTGRCTGWVSRCAQGGGRLCASQHRRWRCRRCWRKESRRGLGAPPSCWHLEQAARDVLVRLLWCSRSPPTLPARSRLCRSPEHVTRPPAITPWSASTAARPLGRGGGCGVRGGGPARSAPAGPVRVGIRRSSVSSMRKPRCGSAAGCSRETVAAAPPSSGSKALRQRGRPRTPGAGS
ncbi:hypothetical protein SAFG77S_00903 [Streptomyces afghaniensis]